MGERVSTKETKWTLASVLTAYEKQVLRDDVLCHSQSQEHLEGYKDVLAFLADRGGMHREYKHYATRARIAGILRDSALYLTDGASWNDKYDREHFNPFFMSTKRFGRASRLPPPKVSRCGCSMGHGWQWGDDQLRSPNVAGGDGPRIVRMRLVRYRREVSMPHGAAG